ncbi:MAG TPA: LuxR family transcriptional regulator, partial [Candidatus Cloacimonetes bacterium]|nr:LuxR family transcriptional regulator [Candidatus Cloacimonadota bacterium]
LTQREAEIMELIETGIGNEEIAEKLFVSRNTIKFHIKNIFIKLDVRNRVQALHKMTM